MARKRATSSTATRLEQAGMCGIARAALICECSRDTIRRIIAERRVKPVGEDRDAPLYSIKEILAAYFGVEPKRNGGAAPSESRRLNPDTMVPAERNAYYQSEQKRLDLEERAGTLVPAEDFREQAASLCGELVKFLDSLPDELEQEHNLEPEVVNTLHKKIRSARQRLYEQVKERSAAAA